MNITDVLKKCNIISIGMLVYTSIITTVFGDLAFSIHHWFFDISREHFNLMMVGFLGVFKIIWIMIFAIPYISIIWSQKKNSS